MNKTLTSIILASVLATGCATHSRSEKQWLGACIFGQSADYMTSRYAISKGGREANPVLGDANGVLYGKLALFGLLYTAQKIFPEDRKALYKFGTYLGLGASSWNLYQVNKFGEK